MNGYRVTFFKDLVNDQGRQFHCPQFEICIRKARDGDRALRAAKRRFERSRKAHHWSLFADQIEVELLSRD